MDKERYVDTLAPVVIQVGYGDLGRNGQLGYEDKPVVVAGRAYRHALSTHPPARVRYRLNGGYVSFGCQVALNDDVRDPHVYADFTVLVDRRPVATARVRAGERPRPLQADVTGAGRLELKVDTNHWDNCHAVWLEPRLSGQALPAVAPATLVDCLRRAEITLPDPPPAARRCLATVVSPGFEHLLADMLGSFYANGNCPEALVVVFTIGHSPACEQVIAQYGATPIRCRPLGPSNPTLKAVLYSVAKVVEAEQYLCLDADMLVLGDLQPLFAALEACPPDSILCCREGNNHGYHNLEHVLTYAYSGLTDDLDAILGQANGEAGYPLVVNDGLFAGRREALLTLDADIRAMPRAVAWVDQHGHIGWRNQFIFNLALARLHCGIELDPTYNVQLHVQDAAIDWIDGRMQATWRGHPARVLHFGGAGRNKYPAWRGLFARPSPLARPGAADSFPLFRAALRRWVGRYGTPALTWSFYGTGDGRSARVGDAGVLSLLAALHYLVRANGCERVLETGTARGVSAACLAAAVFDRPRARVVTIDLGPQPERLALWAGLPPAMTACIEERRGDSLALMRQALAAGESYEAALLDSLHTAEHVWAEFELAAQLVCPGGLILIHDAQLANATVDKALRQIEAAGYGVTRLWMAEAGVRVDDNLGLAVIENRRRPAG